MKGAEYRIEDVVGADVVRARGGRVLLVGMVEGQSTTRMLATRRALRRSQRALNRHPNEALVRDADAFRALLDRLVELFRQAQADGAVLLAQLEFHRLIRKVIFAEIGRRDESFRLFVRFEIRNFL